MAKKKSGKAGAGEAGALPGAAPGRLDQQTFPLGPYQERETCLSCEAELEPCGCYETHGEVKPAVPLSSS